MIKINMLRPKWSGCINGKPIMIMHIVPDWATDYAPTAYDLEYQWRAYREIFGDDRPDVLHSKQKPEFKENNK